MIVVKTPGPIKKGVAKGTTEALFFSSILLPNRIPNTISRPITKTIIAPAIWKLLNEIPKKSYSRISIRPKIKLPIGENFYYQSEYYYYWTLYQ